MQQCTEQVHVHLSCWIYRTYMSDWCVSCVQLYYYCHLLHRICANFKLSMQLTECISFSRSTLLLVVNYRLGEFGFKIILLIYAHDSVYFEVINNCASSPCHNGATCVSSGSSYTCTCDTGYTGNKCTSSKC